MLTPDYPSRKQIPEKRRATLEKHQAASNSNYQNKYIGVETDTFHTYYKIYSSHTKKPSSPSHMCTFKHILWASSLQVNQLAPKS
ncbi:hypothetical protein L1887_29094 [Cichorium endivia]|nr:hypothetical protein L1887_29094 [Cichorium endivia]